MAYMSGSLSSLDENVTIFTVQVGLKYIQPWTYPDFNANINASLKPLLS